MPVVLVQQNLFSIYFSDASRVGSTPSISSLVPISFAAEELITECPAPILQLLAEIVPLLLSLQVMYRHSFRLQIHQK
jgi:hypothetical protein